MAYSSSGRSFKNTYFRQLPNLDYPSLANDRTSAYDYNQVKNIFKRAVLREDVINSYFQFNQYLIEGDDRPDNVANDVYGDPTLDWVVLMANNITNVQNEWPLSNADFYTYLTEKYDNETTLYSGIHHYESREVQANDGTIIIPSGQRVSIGQSVSFFDEDSSQQIVRTDVAMPITNYAFEEKLNDEKRNIFVLKPIYLNIIFDDINQLMRNKKGSTQFISETLVRGDDIRLYD